MRLVTLCHTLHQLTISFFWHNFFKIKLTWHTSLCTNSDWLNHKPDFHCFMFVLLWCNVSSLFEPMTQPHQCPDQLGAASQKGFIPEKSKTISMCLTHRLQPWAPDTQVVTELPNPSTLAQEGVSGSASSPQQLPQRLSEYNSTIESAQILEGRKKD